jgi:hypothetical protein
MQGNIRSRCRASTHRYTSLPGLDGATSVGSEQSRGNA